MPSTAAGARGSSDQSRSSPETVAATLLSSVTAALASIPEDKCICRMKCACRKESPVSPWRACSVFRAAVTESLRVECESLPVDDALAHTFEDASRNIYKHAYELCGSSWSETEDQDEDTSPGPSASSARSTRTPSMRDTLHASLPHAPAKKRGLVVRKHRASRGRLAAAIALRRHGSVPRARWGKRHSVDDHDPKPQGRAGSCAQRVAVDQAVAR